MATRRTSKAPVTVESVTAPSPSAPATLAEILEALPWSGSEKHLPLHLLLHRLPDASTLANLGYALNRVGPTLAVLNASRR